MKVFIWADDTIEAVIGFKAIAVAETKEEAVAYIRKYAKEVGQTDLSFLENEEGVGISEPYREIDMVGLPAVALITTPASVGQVNGEALIIL